MAFKSIFVGLALTIAGAQAYFPALHGNNWYCGYSLRFCPEDELLEACGKIDQSTTTTTSSPISNDACSCIKVDGSDKCLSYDANEMAMTLEDAFENFRDPTEFDPEQAKPFGHRNEKRKQPKPGKTNQTMPRLPVPLPARNAFDRKTELHDRKKLLDKIEPNGREPGTPCKESPSCRACAKQVLIAMEKGLEGDDSALTNDTRHMIENTWKSYDLASIDADLCPDETLSPSMHIDPQPDRQRRQATGVARAVSVGMNCDYQRGMVVDSSGSCGLCSLCWNWKMLDANYIPRILNERTCSADTRCLSGYGNCRPKYGQRGVAYMQGSYAVEHSVQTILDCSCQVNQNSPLYSFIVS